MIQRKPNPVPIHTTLLDVNSKINFAWMSYFLLENEVIQNLVFNLSLMTEEINALKERVNQLENP